MYSSLGSYPSLPKSFPLWSTLYVKLRRKVSFRRPIILFETLNWVNQVLLIHHQESSHMNMEPRSPVPPRKMSRISDKSISNQTILWIHFALSFYFLLDHMIHFSKSVSRHQRGESVSWKSSALLLFVFRIYLSCLGIPCNGAYIEGTRSIILVVTLIEPFCNFPSFALCWTPLDWFVEVYTHLIFSFIIINMLVW